MTERIPRLLVDADACPVVREAEECARRAGMPMVLLCDEHHLLQSSYARVVHVSSGADAVDIALINICRAGDVVITQDYGVAAMALGRGAYALHQSGREYTNDNIDLLLMERHVAGKARRAAGKKHLRGPKRFTQEDRDHFTAALTALMTKAMQTGGNPIDDC